MRFLLVENLHQSIFIIINFSSFIFKTIALRCLRILRFSNRPLDVWYESLNGESAQDSKQKRGYTSISLVQLKLTGHIEALHPRCFVHLVPPPVTPAVLLMRAHCDALRCVV